MCKEHDLEFETVITALDEEERSRVQIEDNFTMIIVDVPVSYESDTYYSTVPLGIVKTDKLLLTNSGSKEEVLAAINSIFINFAGFVTAIGKPNSVFHNGKYGKFNVRYTDNIIIIQWSNANAIHHVALSEDGSYTYNTIQIVDQTLYRLSNLTIDPIVNPKIWVGTATQYAAIAQKDNNTTYIVKSDA